MISKNLLDAILIKPFEENIADKLCVIAGHATSAMVSKHFKALEEVQQKKKLSAEVSIELIVGMCIQEGLKLVNHRGFQKLVDEDFAGRFKCSYIDRRPPVNSKVYIWLKNEFPVRAFIGSADYSQNAFFRGQREVLVECDPKEGYDYYQTLIGETVYCTHLDADNFIKTPDDEIFLTLAAANFVEVNDENQLDADTEDETESSEVCISFLDKKGGLPAKSGLNWGLDGKGNKRQPHRTGNEAYIKVPSAVYHTDFFPGISEHFTILTDDDISLLCTREQSKGKSITTPKNNSQMGEYFRRRLGIGSGKPVLKSDLERYGRTNVCFTKLDEESYFMDFSV